MSDIPVEQAIYGNTGSGGYRFLARSPGFLDDWLPAAEHLCTGFGERPAGVACPHALFAQPLGSDHVAVVQVADQGRDDAGRPGALGFHLLVLPRKAYTQVLAGDPFPLAERFPPPWDVRGDLPALSLPAVPRPPQSVTEVQRILKGTDGPTLLGGVQALVDGSRLVFERPAPATELVRGLWALLPDSTRRELWPTTFAFGHGHHFDVLVLARVEPGTSDGYLTEDQAGDYPQGRYELNLQVAAETGDQDQLNALFARRSSSETLRLALVLVAVFLALAAVMNVLNQQTASPPTASRKPAPPPTALLERYPSLEQHQRVDVGKHLTDLGQELQVPWPSGRPSIDQMLAALDQQLGTPDPTRDPGPLAKAAPGDLQKQLRLLMWKHHVDGWDNPALNPVELAERLHRALGTAKGKTEPIP